MVNTKKLSKKASVALRKVQNALTKSKTPKRHLVTLPRVVGGAVVIGLIFAGLKVLGKKKPTDTDDFLDADMKQESALRST